MALNQFGWKPGDSSGEGLSKLGSFTLYPDQRNTLNGPQVWLDTSVGATPAKPSRPDFVNTTEPVDFKLRLVRMRSFVPLLFAIPAWFQHEGGCPPHTLDPRRRLRKSDQGSRWRAGVLRSSHARFPPGTPCDLAGSTIPFLFQRRPSQRETVHGEQRSQSQTDRAR